MCLDSHFNCPCGKFEVKNKTSQGTFVKKTKTGKKIAGGKKITMLSHKYGKGAEKGIK